MWKTWAWETALDQIRDELDDDNRSLEFSKKKKPRLVDVLLGKDVTVYEPFWTLIPSNKAILPILWSLYPDHPNLLNSSFNLTDELKEKGYAMKPIVGRCGSNIKIFAAGDTLLHETAGQFDQRDQIYQELCSLQKIDKDNIQIQSFSVSGFYAGSGIRIDPSPIVVSGSDLPTLRIISNQSFK